MAYSEDSVWRNRDRFVTGRTEIVAFLTEKWERELDYALRKSLWAFTETRIAVRFQYECHDRDDIIVPLEQLTQAIERLQQPVEPD